MYYRYIDTIKFFKQAKVARIIRLSSLAFAIAMLLNELQQERSYTWYFAFLYSFFLLPSLYFTREVQYRHFFHMRNFLNPFRIYTSMMAIIYLVLYFHQVITYEPLVFPPLPPSRDAFP
ncbi:hypothetical protein ACVBIL_05435 [Shewanella sp. 125m-7]